MATLLILYSNLNVKIAIPLGLAIDFIGAYCLGNYLRGVLH